MKYTKLTIAFILVIIFVSSFVNFNNSDEPIEIYATEQKLKSGTQYTYHIFNHGKEIIKRINIGMNMDKLTRNIDVELNNFPETIDEYSFVVSDAVYSGPSTWIAEVMYPEEYDMFSIAILPQSNNDFLKPNKKPYVFKFTVDEQDNGYVNGHTTFHYGKKVVSTKIKKMPAWRNWFSYY